MSTEDDHEHEDDREYYAERMRQERRAADIATSDARPIHNELAKRYAQRMDHDWAMHMPLRTEAD